MTTQSQRGFVKKDIARSILKGSFSLLHADNLRNNEIGYHYFKIDRIEHILARMQCVSVCNGCPRDF